MRSIVVVYLTSHSLSMFGNVLAGVAFPLILLQVTGSAASAGWLAAATAIPAVAGGLLLGVVIDRINRRTSSVVADLVSAASVAALPIVDMVTGLNLGWFILFGIIGSFGDVPGMTAREALLPAIVRHSGVSTERLMGLREGLDAGALLLGPAVAGVLMAMLKGSTVLWITAALSLTAALTTLLLPYRICRIGTDETANTGPDAAGVRQAWSQLLDGWHALMGNQLLIALTAISFVFSFVIGGLQGLILPVHFSLIDRPDLLGFVLTALGAGMLVGGAVYATAGPRGSRRMWLVIGLLGLTAGLVVIGTLAASWIVFVGAFLLGASASVLNAMLGVLLLDHVPEDLRGRILGTQGSITLVAPSAGIFLIALVVEYGSVRLGAGLLVAIWLVAVVAALRARALRAQALRTPALGSLEESPSEVTEVVEATDHA